MENYLVERDLMGVSKSGYKVALILPQMTGEKLKKCIMYYQNIYKNLGANAHRVFNPIEQVVNKRIGRQAYTFLLVRDYGEQDELLTYLPEYLASFARLSDTGVANMLKVMPDGQIIDANLMPLCRIKKISDFDKAKLQALIHNKMNGVENYQYTFVDEGKSGVKIYYQKKRDSLYLKEQERAHYREYRKLRSTRIFYDEAFKSFGEAMFLDENVEFFDELGGPIDKVSLYSFQYREVAQVNKTRSSANGEFEYADFDKIKCPEGFKVLAIKKATKNCEFTYIPRLVNRTYGRVRSFDCEVKVQPAFVDNREVIAIFCKDKSYKYMNNLVNLIYANLMESPYYKNDSTMFYYRDAVGQVLPINKAHICKADSCSIVSEKKLQSVLEDKIGTGFDVQIERGSDEKWDCYSVVNDYEAGRAKSKTYLENGKHLAIREAINTYGNDAIIAQDNDGAREGKEKATQLSR